MVLKSLLARARRKPPQRAVYEQIVAQARQPWFYARQGVADTVSGRFDMIVMHTFLVLERLAGQGGHVAEFSQTLYDEMFMDMDRSLREMGVGDLAVGKRIRKMAEIFHGRAQAYREALLSDGHSALEHAIERNIYPSGAPAGAARTIANYLVDATGCLADQPVEDCLAGRVRFPSLPEGKVQS